MVGLGVGVGEAYIGKEGERRKGEDPGLVYLETERSFGVLLPRERKGKKDVHSTLVSAQDGWMH